MFYSFTDDWKVDQYTWKVHNGTHHLPTGKPCIFKTFTALDRTYAFKRHAWWLSNNTSIILVHYIGDHTTYIPAPHGNSKHTDKEFVRTAPSVINDQKTNDQGSHMKTYKKQLQNKHPPAYFPVYHPRNYTQVANSQIKSRNEARPSHDDIYNLNVLAYHLDGFIKEIITFPDLLFFAGNSEMLCEFNKLVLLNHKGMYLTYDTTFCLGDFYVSIIVFRHILFKKDPLIPLAFMVHDRKFQNVHKKFLQMISIHVPNIQKMKVPFVSDREPGILNAIKIVLPECPLLICWNHVKRDARFWLLNHGSTAKDRQVYRDHLNDILKSETEEDFDQTIEEHSRAWSEPFLTYFNTYLKKSIKEHASAWILISLELYNPSSGITNNVAESFNKVLKEIQDWKEIKCDEFAASVYELQRYYYFEIQRGYCNLGTLELKEEFKNEALNPEDQDFPNVTSPSKLIDEIRYSRRIVDNTLHPSVSSSETSEMSQRDDKPSPKLKEALIQKDTYESKIVSSESFKIPQRDEKSTSQVYLARTVIKEQRISNVPAQQSFLVSSSTNSQMKYAVKLFPNETCSCPSSSSCHHILAARIAVGINDSPKSNKTKINLSKLTKKNKKNQDKKSGKKNPRKGDVEVVPAPDSICKTSTASLSTPFQPNSISKSKRQINFDLSLTIPKSDLSSMSSNQRKDTPKQSKEQLSPTMPHLSPAIKIERQGITDKIIPSPEVTTPSPSSLKLNTPVETISDSPINSPLNEKWLPMYGLNLDDLNILLSPTQWLNNDHINVAMQILRKQFPLINGLHCTRHVPHFVQKDKYWKYDKKFPLTPSPALQIHHNGTNHWITSVKHNERIYFLDSLLNTDNISMSINTALELQLAALYGSPGKNMEINVPRVQHQENSTCCGVFAIANAVEFCVNNTWENSINFKKDEMRSHIIKCFEEEEFTPFPSTSTNRRQRGYKVHISTTCPCGMPDSMANLVSCKLCLLVWHETCIALQNNIQHACPYCLI